MNVFSRNDLAAAVKGSVFTFHLTQPPAPQSASAICCCQRATFGNHLSFVPSFTTRQSQFTCSFRQHPAESGILIHIPRHTGRSLPNGTSVHLWVFTAFVFLKENKLYLEQRRRNLQIWWIISGWWFCSFVPFLVFHTFFIVCFYSVFCNESWSELVRYKSSYRFADVWYFCKLSQASFKENFF